MPFTDVGGPLPEVARAGREMSRYGADGQRLLAGSIPHKFVGPQSAENVRILMIQSKNKEGWCLPKGGWEQDEEMERAAKRETVEEAGVRGKIQGQVGVFEFQSHKAESQAKANQGRGQAHMFALLVLEELDTWPESGRDRRWFTLPEAIANVRHAWMGEALRQWQHQQGWHVSSSWSDVSTSTYLSYEASQDA